MSDTDSDHCRTSRIPKKVFDVRIDGETAVVDAILEEAVSRCRTWLETRPADLRPKSDEALRNALSTFCQVTVRYDVDEWMKYLLDRKFTVSTLKKYVVREEIPVGRGGRGRGSMRGVGRGASRGLMRGAGPRRSLPAPTREIKSFPAIVIASGQWGTVEPPVTNRVFGKPDDLARRVLWYLQTLPQLLPLRQFRSGLQQILRVKACVPTDVVVACLNGEPQAPWSQRTPLPKGSTARALQSFATNRNLQSTGSRSAPNTVGQNVDDDKVASQGVSGSLLFRKSGKPNAIIAAFDLDDCLITTKLGQVHPEGREDWKWLHPSVPTKLKDLVQRGYRIVIFTNQGGIQMKGPHDESSRAREIMGKIDDIATELDLPLSAVVATKDDAARKPSAFMWDWFCGNLNTGVQVDLSECFFVGDAAGRKIKTLAGRERDFSCTDRKFAYNVGVKFLTPEEFLLGSAPVPFEWDGISPDDLERALAHRGVNYGSLASPAREVVVLVGMPGSGKSTVSMALAEAGYERVNRDTLKTMDACYEAASRALELGKSVVVDNTNGSVEDRKRWVDLAKKNLIVARAFVLTTSYEMAQHLATMREKLGRAAHIPKLVYRMFQSKYQEPATGEGFVSIVRIPFVANFQEGSEERRLFLHLS